jgi:hypothetical protein
LDAAGAPILVNGQPQYEMIDVVVGTKLETKRVQLSATEVQALKNLYIKSFKDSYERYYAKQYASQNYHSEGAEKYKVAQIIGNLIGQDVASQLARKDAYGSQYKSQSASKFAEVSKKLYKQSFDRLISIFENNSVVELNNASIEGEVADSIFRPGEKLKMNFSISNLGEVSKPITMSFENTSQVNANNNGYVFNPAPLRRENHQTPFLAQVSGNLSAREKLTVAMGITNVGDLAEVAQNLVVRKSEPMIINDLAEIDNVNPGLNSISGKLEVGVTIVNPSSSKTPTVGDVQLFIDGIGMVQSKAFVNLGSNNSQVINLETNNIDPMSIINSGKITGQVAVVIAGRTVHEIPFESTANAAKDAMIVRYFDGLATKEITNTGNESKQDRIASLIGLIDASIQRSVNNRVKWGKKVHFNATLMPEIQRVYDESKRQGTLSADAQAQYDLLASELARNVIGLKARGILNDKKHRKAYLRELSYISKKISVNPKDYK